MEKIKIEIRNGHDIYEIDNGSQYEIDFRDGGVACAETLQQARKISDEYNQLLIDQENFDLLDMASEQDLY